VLRTRLRVGRVDGFGGAVRLGKGGVVRLGWQGLAGVEGWRSGFGVSGGQQWGMGREARSKRWWLSHRVVWLLLMGFVFGVVTAAVVVIQWRIAAARGEAFDLLVAVGWAAAVGAIVALSIGLFGFVVIVGAVEPEERFSFRSWGSGEGGGEGSESHAAKRGEGE